MKNGSPEPSGENRFVAEHLDQADVVLPDGTTISMAEYIKQVEAKRKSATKPKVQIHIHRD
jgi:hypothetical protein